MPPHRRPEPAVVVLEDKDSSAAVLQPSVAAVRDRHAGLYDALDQLTYGFLKPLAYQGLFKTLLAPSGVLLYGPPGTGKTMLALHGLTVNKIRTIADALKQGRAVAPAILLLDELDCVFPARSSEAGSKQPSILSQLLVKLDHAGPARVALLATIDCPGDLDYALRRRLPLQISVLLPNMMARRKMLEMGVKMKVKTHHKLTENNAIFKGTRRPTKLPPLIIRYFMIPELPSVVITRKRKRPSGAGALTEIAAAIKAMVQPDESSSNNIGSLMVDLLELNGDSFDIDELASLGYLLAEKSNLVTMYHSLSDRQDLRRALLLRILRA
ncbi:mitochondrial dynamin GTPase Msp1 [Tilletia horrida]|uniref:Mitochondrial dynamin GTPase Msp1 n=1 Tax=Tilletia horrida TaxID=155126 RepID=A0AAN6GM09_9BASI|nr:mitochondrial dynamin GTPase Msp1 [Tilletia horrida]KAK0545368.1 mitochondrial dynamin GTPase Msp1 [Tilletia horrida]